MLEGAELIGHHGGGDGVRLVGRADDVEVGVDGDFRGHSTREEPGRRGRVGEVLVCGDEVRGGGRGAAVAGRDILRGV